MQCNTISCPFDPHTAYDKVSTTKRNKLQQWSDSQQNSRSLLHGYRLHLYPAQSSAPLYASISILLLFLYSWQSSAPVQYVFAMHNLSIVADQNLTRRLYSKGLCLETHAWGWALLPAMPLVTAQPESFRLSVITAQLAAFGLWGYIKYHLALDYVCTTNELCAKSQHVVCAVGLGLLCRMTSSMIIMYGPASVQCVSYALVIFSCATILFLYAEYACEKLGSTSRSFSLLPVCAYNDTKTLHPLSGITENLQPDFPSGYIAQMRAAANAQTSSWQQRKTMRYQS